MRRSRLRERKQYYKRGGRGSLNECESAEGATGVGCKLLRWEEGASMCEAGERSKEEHVKGQKGQNRQNREIKGLRTRRDMHIRQRNAPDTVDKTSTWGDGLRYPGC